MLKVLSSVWCKNLENTVPAQLSSSLLGYGSAPHFVVNKPHAALECNHYFQSAFRRDSSSKPETDESHLVRDLDCMVDGVGTPNQELQYGFVLPLPSHPKAER
ncbi:hypothetical protein TNCV_3561861 [Trichonephila clavipes]|nr:hypothetical protein TNCV_3561861 [Trichonephila clavipes]